MSLSRACTIAATVAADYESARVKTFCHACCEGRGCKCACHRGEVEMTGYRTDPVPVLTKAAK